MHSSFTFLRNFTYQNLLKRELHAPIIPVYREKYFSNALNLQKKKTNYIIKSESKQQASQRKINEEQKNNNDNPSTQILMK